MKGSVVFVSLLALATPVWAGGSPADDAPRAEASYLDLAPLEGRPSGEGVLTPWGYLDVSLNSTPTGLPVRLKLDPKPVWSEHPATSTAAPYLAIGRVAPLDTELPPPLQGPGADKIAPLKTAVGLSLGLGRHAEITGEYQFLGINESALSQRSSVDRTLNTGRDSFGLNFNLSIKY